MSGRPNVFNDCTGEAMVARHWTVMAEILLKLGGDEAVRPDSDPQIAKVLERGSLQEGRQVRRLGQPHQCHANSSELWLRSHGELLLCTGYALNEQRSWLQHSWCVAVGGPGEPVIFETTDPDWARYFGIMLDEAESFAVAMANIKPQQRLADVFGDCPRMAERLGKILAVQGDR